jgi:hypothetical protein
MGRGGGRGDFSHISRPLCALPWFLLNGYRISFPWVKRPGRGVNHPLPSSSEVKERVELYVYCSSGPSWPVLVWALSLNMTQSVTFTRHFERVSEYCEVNRDGMLEMWSILPDGRRNVQWVNIRINKDRGASDRSVAILSGLGAKQRSSKERNGTEKKKDAGS